MSWNLSARGQPKAVKRIIDEQANARYDPIPADENTQQKRSVAALLIAQIDCLKLPNTEYNGVRVEASGHLHGGWGNLRFELSMDRFSLDEAEPVGEEGLNKLIERTVISPPGITAVESIGVVTDQAAAIAALHDEKVTQALAAPSPCPDCGQTDGHSRGCARYT